MLSILAKPPAIAPAIIETVLTSLAPLFLAGAGGDIAASRDAASRMLAAYRPQTEDELRLAANIVGFGFHALEALGQAATPDLPLTRVLRLRGNAVSLSREAARAQRQLAQFQKTRRHIETEQGASDPQQDAPRHARGDFGQILTGATPRPDRVNAGAAPAGRDCPANAAGAEAPSAEVDAGAFQQEASAKLSRVAGSANRTAGQVGEHDPAQDPGCVTGSASLHGQNACLGNERDQQETRIAASLKRAAARLAGQCQSTVPAKPATQMLADQPIPRNPVLAQAVA